MYNVSQRPIEKESVWSVKGFSLTLQENKKNTLYTGEQVDNMISP